MPAILASEHAGVERPDSTTGGPVAKIDIDRRSSGFLEPLARWSETRPKLAVTVCGFPRIGEAARSAEIRGVAILDRAKGVTLVPGGAWEVDPARSTAGFTVRHLKVAKVRGRFTEIRGVISCDPHGRTSIDGSVEVASIDTGDARRDDRLRGADFFDAERYPAISFSAVSQAVVTGEVPVVSGTMTVRGVAQPLGLQLDGLGSPIGGNGELRIRGTGVLSRRAFGLAWDSAFAAGGLVIDDRVGLHLDIVLRPH